MSIEFTLVTHFHSKLKRVMLRRTVNKGEPLSQRRLAKDTGIALSQFRVGIAMTANV